MRTTVNIDGHLLRRAKELAARSDRSLGAVVDDALRILLTERQRVTSSVELPIYGGSGLQLGVDLEDKDALADLLDDAGEQRAAG